jgi:hypothetical protein
VLGRTRDDFRRSNPDADIPSDDDLLVPQADVIRPILNERVAVMSGSPKLGKTTAAWLIAYWRFVYEEEPLQVKEADGPQSCSESLSSDFANTELRILEAPFGKTQDYQKNPSFLTALETANEVLQEGGDPSAPASCQIVVTSRLSNWTKGTQDWGRAPDLLVSSSRHSDWYAVDALLDYGTPLATDPVSADRLRFLVEDAVSEDAKRISTPAQVKSFARNGREPSRSARGLDDDTEDVVMVFEACPALARLGVLVRLQRFSHELTPEDSLRELALLPVTEVGLSKELFKQLKVDDFTVLTFEHSTGIDAIDFYIQEHRSDVERIVKTSPEWAREAWNVYDAIDAARHDDTSSLESLSDDVRKQWIPEIYGCTAKDDVLEFVDLSELDMWSTNELIHEIVRLWDFARSGRIADQLRRRSLDVTNPLLTYAMLQASLYLGPGVDPSIWEPLLGPIWELLPGEPSGPLSEDRLTALALVFDGFVWKKPFHAINREAWTKRLLASRPPDDPLMGAIYFSCAYHFSEAVQLLGVERLESVEAAGLSSEQAAWVQRMMEWHFLHQSRAWAFLATRSFKATDHLARKGSADLVPDEEAGRYIEGLIRRMTSTRGVDSAGWAFHLGINAYWNVDNTLNASVIKDALTAANPASPGVISATLAYEIPADVREAVRDYFETDQNRSALLDAMSDGLVIGGEKVQTPRFCFNRQPLDTFRALQIRWESLRDYIPLESLIATLPAARKKLLARGLDREAVLAATARGLSGDFRDLAEATRARSAPGAGPASTLEKVTLLLERAALLYEPPESLD